VTEVQSNSTMDAKEKLGRSNGSIFKKHSLAKEYKEVAKSLFIIVEVSLSCERRAQLDSL
jgi:hypothetical protein